MNFANAVRAIPGTFALLVLLTQSCPAQTSIGFDNPDDTTNIFEYRLPDWGYRTWDLGFALSGAGSDYTAGDNHRINNRLSTNLRTDFRLFRESEKRTGVLDVTAAGSYRRSHIGTETREDSGHNLAGNYFVGGHLNQYMGAGQFFLGLSGNVGQSYLENVLEASGADESRYFRRGYSYGIGPSVGWGRARDVTPLIRAQRLSERLVALDRPPLSSDQVQQIARVLATEQGYRTVFDRPQRSFWRDVLEPLLEEENPLSPYEIFYLRDILTEDIGPRREGVELRGTYFYREFSSDYNEAETRGYSRNPSLNFLWVRNLSFDHQLTLNTGVSYRQSDQTKTGSLDQSYSEKIDTLRGNFYLAHLWTIADRYRLDTILDFVGSYHERNFEASRWIERDFRTALMSKFRVFLEDNMSLVASVRGVNTQGYDDFQDSLDAERYSRSWSWSYGIGIEYYLDRVLY